MTYETIATLTVKTRKGGEFTIMPGQVINLAPKQAGKLLAIGKIRDVIKPAREIMDERYKVLFARIRQYDLEEADMGSDLWGAIQNVLETMDGAYLRNDLTAFQDAFDEVNLLYAKALFRTDRRIALRLYSEVLGVYLWVVKNDKDMRSLVAQGIAEAVYTADEVRKLKGLSVEGLKAVHEAKVIFENSRVILMREKT